MYSKDRDGLSPDVEVPEMYLYFPSDHMWFRASKPAAVAAVWRVCRRHQLWTLSEHAKRRNHANDLEISGE